MRLRLPLFELTLDTLSIIVTVVALVSFCLAFTFLFHNYYSSSIRSIRRGDDDLELIDNSLQAERARRSVVHRVFHYIGKSGSYLILGALAAMLGIAAYSRITGAPIMIGGSGYIVIATGSMSKIASSNSYLKNEENQKIYTLDNQFDAYDVIGLTRYSSIDQVNLYDVIAYRNKEGTTIVHRIIEVHKNEEGEIEGFVTRGDAVEVSDNYENSEYEGYLSYDAIYGYYNGNRIQAVGSFIIFLQSASGIITVFAIVYCLFMFDFFASKYQKAIDKRTDLLLECLGYEPEKENPESVNAYYEEIVYYKGMAYFFNDGEFVFKQPIEEPELTKRSLHTIIKVGDDGQEFETVVMNEDPKEKKKKKKNNDYNEEDSDNDESPEDEESSPEEPEQSDENLGNGDDQDPENSSEESNNSPSPSSSSLMEADEIKSPTSDSGDSINTSGTEPKEGD